MILPFSIQLNGKPTYFVERIHKSFSLKEVYMKVGLDPTIHYPPNYNFVAKDKLPPKLHTIREDKNDRWKAGTKIDFFINCRQPSMFRFAPVLPVVSVQEIEIIYLRNIEFYKPEGIVKVTQAVIEVDRDYYGSAYIENKKVLNHTDRLIELVSNDGFDTVEDFFRYFDKDFKGKLIHWTDLKY